MRERAALVSAKLCYFDLLPWVMQACDMDGTYAVGRAKAYRLLCMVRGVRRGGGGLRAAVRQSCGLCVVVCKY